MTYDPAFMNTASCRSAITYIDGDKGSSSTAATRSSSSPSSRPTSRSPTCSIHGELPTQSQLDEWTHQVTIHTFVHENVKAFMQGFRYDAHPMGMLAGLGRRAVDLLSRRQRRSRTRRSATSRSSGSIAKMPTLAAFAFRHNMGQPYVYPDNDLRYPGNFLSMMYKMTELKYEPDPRLERALDILFILHADHEQNCSTSAVRASAPPRSTPTRPSRPASPRSTARSTAAPTRRCCGCCAGSRPRRTSPTSSAA